ncbi:putative integral membrane protein [Leishmania donovani]|uniref:Putative integral membrane protein n=1 Tax=Leishmania donovani TaxID=5661 RepID=A0A504XYK1_LEIDO|nr:putative integral membrane protein [Leishmania donovani]
MATAAAEAACVTCSTALCSSSTLSVDPMKRRSGSHRMDKTTPASRSEGSACTASYSGSAVLAEHHRTRPSVHGFGRGDSREARWTHRPRRALRLTKRAAVCVLYLLLPFLLYHSTPPSASQRLPPARASITAATASICAPFLFVRAVEYDLTLAFQTNDYVDNVCVPSATAPAAAIDLSACPYYPLWSLLAGVSSFGETARVDGGNVDAAAAIPGDLTSTLSGSRNALTYYYQVLNTDDFFFMLQGCTIQITIDGDVPPSYAYNSFQRYADAYALNVSATGKDGSISGGSGGRGSLAFPAGTRASDTEGDGDEAYPNITLRTAFFFWNQPRLHCAYNAPALMSMMDDAVLAEASAQPADGEVAAGRPVASSAGPLYPSCAASMPPPKNILPAGGRNTTLTVNYMQLGSSVVVKIFSFDVWYQLTGTPAPATLSKARTTTTAAPASAAYSAVFSSGPITRGRGCSTGVSTKNLAAGQSLKLPADPEKVCTAPALYTISLNPLLARASSWSLGSSTDWLQPSVMVTHDYPAARVIAVVAQCSGVPLSFSVKANFLNPGNYPGSGQHYATSIIHLFFLVCYALLLIVFLVMIQYDDEICSRGGIIGAREYVCGGEEHDHSAAKPILVVADVRSSGGGPNTRPETSSLYTAHSNAHLTSSSGIYDDNDINCGSSDAASEKEQRRAKRERQEQKKQRSRPRHHVSATSTSRRYAANDLDDDRRGSSTGVVSAFASPLRWRFRAVGMTDVVGHQVLDPVRLWWAESHILVMYAPIQWLVLVLLVLRCLLSVLLAAKFFLLSRAVHRDSLMGNSLSLVCIIFEVATDTLLIPIEMLVAMGWGLAFTAPLPTNQIVTVGLATLTMFIVFVFSAACAKDGLSMALTANRYARLINGNLCNTVAYTRAAFEMVCRVHNVLRMFLLSLWLSKTVVPADAAAVQRQRRLSHRQLQGAQNECREGQGMAGPGDSSSDGVSCRSDLHRRTSSATSSSSSGQCDGSSLVYLRYRGMWVPFAMLLVWAVLLLVFAFTFYEPEDYYMVVAFRELQSVYLLGFIILFLRTAHSGRRESALYGCRAYGVTGGVAATSPAARGGGCGKMPLFTKGLTTCCSPPATVAHTNVKSKDSLGNLDDAFTATPASPVERQVTCPPDTSSLTSVASAATMTASSTTRRTHDSANDVDSSEDDEGAEEDRADLKDGHTVQRRRLAHDASVEAVASRTPQPTSRAPPHHNARDFEGFYNTGFAAAPFPSAALNASLFYMHGSAGRRGSDAPISFRRSQAATATPGPHTEGHSKRPASPASVKASTVTAARPLSIASRREAAGEQLCRLAVTLPTMTTVHWLSLVITLLVPVNLLCLDVMALGWIRRRVDASYGGASALPSSGRTTAPTSLRVVICGAAGVSTGVAEAPSSCGNDSGFTVILWLLAPTGFSADLLYTGSGDPLAKQSLTAMSRRASLWWTYHHPAASSTDEYRHLRAEWQVCCDVYERVRQLAPQLEVIELFIRYACLWVMLHAPLPCATVASEWTGAWLLNSPAPEEEKAMAPNGSHWRAANSVTASVLPRRAADVIAAA